MHPPLDRLDPPKRPFPYAHSRTHSHNLAHSLAPTDIKLPNSTSKGKQKDSDDFRFGAWDFIPLLESRRPPVQWTSSSLIITAHGTEPRVVCLHFPSNKRFILPDPPGISASPTSYGSPSILVASSRDDWIFAYFPGNDVDGVGCFWSKPRLVDDWVIREWRTFARGDSVVTARWLNSEREWSSSDLGTPVRLPALGPYIPTSHPILVVVTETRLCDVFYIHPQTEKMHMLSASLARRSTSKEGQERPIGERVDGPQGLGKCVHAAIGLGYDESSLLISMFASFVPAATSNISPQNSTEMNLSLSVPPSFEEPEITSNWDSWKDENIIEICEVNISIDGYLLSLATAPLPSIRDLQLTGRCLTSMVFAPSFPLATNQPGIPSTPTQTHRRVTPQSSPATLPAHVSQSPGRSILRSPIKGSAVPKPILEKAKVRPSGALYLLCTILELGQFTSAPSSELISYILWRNPVDPQTWYFRRESQIAMPSNVVVHLSPFQPVNAVQHTTALLGVLHREGQPVKRKGDQRLTVGKLQVIRLPELQIDDSWETVNLISPVGQYGVELPFGFATSSNRALVCAVPNFPSISLSSNISAFIHRHPVKGLQSNQESTPSKSRKQLVTFIELSLRRRFAPADVLHSQCPNDTPLSVIEEALANILDFDTNIGTKSDVRVKEIIGVAVEVYRKRSLSPVPDAEISDLKLRYQTGVEICWLSACNAVWEETFGPWGYDPEAIWNLTSLCGYFMEEFLEKLLKECVQLASEVSLAESLAQQTTPQTHLSSSLLHLVHPYALDLLHFFIQHVRRFRGFLGSHTRSEEHLQVAREILIDAVDSSPINLEALDRVLSEIKTEVKANSEQHPELARRSLAALKPAAEYSPLLQKIVTKLMQAQVADKLALFITPGDLVDSTLGLSTSPSGKNHERDVITKRYLTGQNPTVHCLRCGGASEVDTKLTGIQPGHSSIRWATWERNWHAHCICDGLWSSRI